MGSEVGECAAALAARLMSSLPLPTSSERLPEGEADGPHVVTVVAATPDMDIDSDAETVVQSAPQQGDSERGIRSLPNPAEVCGRGVHTVNNVEDARAGAEGGLSAVCMVRESVCGEVQAVPVEEECTYGSRGLRSSPPCGVVAGDVMCGRSDGGGSEEV